MFRRTAASLVIVTGLVAGVSGCAFITPQATEIHYQASDGTEANVGPLQLRNFVIISDDGVHGTLVGAISNTSNQTVTTELKYFNAAGVQDHVIVSVDSLGVTPVGYDGTSGALSDIKTAPGELFPVYVQYGTDEGVEMDVPVLDGSQSQFATFVPTATPTPAVTATPTPTATN